MKKRISRDINKFKVLNGTTIEERLHKLLINDRINKKTLVIHYNGDYLNKHSKKEYDLLIRENLGEVDFTRKMILKIRKSGKK